jgi:hypothetical protein
VRLVLAELGYLGGDDGGLWISFRPGAEPYGFVFDIDADYRVEDETLATFLTEAGISAEAVWQAIERVIG